MGGGVIKQYFGDYVWDSNITFSAYLLHAEAMDMIAAKAEGSAWTLADAYGGSYEVTFDLKEGFVVESKVKANDRYYCKFKFRRET